MRLNLDLLWRLSFSLLRTRPQAPSLPSTMPPKKTTVKTTKAAKTCSFAVKSKDAACIRNALGGTFFCQQHYKIVFGTKYESPSTVQRVAPPAVSNSMEQRVARIENLVLVEASKENVQSALPQYRVHERQPPPQSVLSYKTSLNGTLVIYGAENYERPNTSQRANIPQRQPLQRAIQPSIENTTTNDTNIDVDMDEANRINKRKRDQLYQEKMDIDDL